MTPETFLEEFGALAETEGGIGRLRQLVLEMAIRGAVTSQEKTDGTASAALALASKDRDRLVAAGEIRRAKDESVVGRSEELFKIPETWRWARFGSLGDWGAGATPSRARADYYGGTMPWLKSGELPDGRVSTAAEHVTEIALKECSLRINHPGDVLVAMYGATIGRAAILDVQATSNQAVCACTCFEGVYNEFLFVALRAYRSRFIAQGEGGAQPNISKIKIVRTPVAVPPLPEQKRIVKKVDELMALCDELEAKQKQKRSTAVTLNKSALNAVVTAPTTAALKSAWTRVQDHFEVLYDCPENVQDLRQTILQLAVMGKLIKQDPNDEPAEKLLERITVQQSKVALLHKTRAPAGFHHDAGGQRGPSGWALPCLGALGVFVGGGTPSKANPQYWEGDIPWVSPKDMKRLLIHDSIDHISEAAIAESSVKRIPPGAILAVVRGMILAHSFRADGARRHHQSGHEGTRAGGRTPWSVSSHGPSRPPRPCSEPDREIVARHLPS